jgi:divalent metal cation (Fe/Co/Zn/Cd) transporter
LLGERADPDTVAAILDIARRTSGVTDANEIFTIQLAPEQVVAALSLNFEDSLSAADVETIVAMLEHRIRASHPDITTILIKPQSERD